MLLDKGYSAVAQIDGGWEAWTKAAYPTYPVIKTTAQPTGQTTQTTTQPTTQFIQITLPLTLINSDANGTHIPNGSTIYHWANGITEVDLLDGSRFFVSRDSEAVMATSTSGQSLPATWVYHLPDGTITSTAAAEGDSKSITKMYLNGNLILTVIVKSGDFPG